MHISKQERVLSAEFNPQGTGNLYLGLRDKELSRQERKFLRMSGLTEGQITHLASNIKHASDRVPLYT